MKYLVGFIILLIAVGVGLRYFSDGESLDSGVVQEAEEIDFSATELVDCGRAVFDTGEIGGGIFELAGKMRDLRIKDEVRCFDERFKRCLPAVLVEGMANVNLARYKIIGPVNEQSCAVEVSYEAHSVGSLVGLGMICIQDNSKVFDKVGFTGCSGELYEALGQAGF